MLAEFRVATRSLRRTPGFTVVAVLTLALGIGAVTAVFSVLNVVLLRPPPYPGHERLMVPFSTNPARGIDISRIGPADYLDWRREQVFEQLAIVDTLGRSFDLADEAGDPEQVRTIHVSREYFSVLGISKPALGRLFLPEESFFSAGVPRPCMLSYGLWQRRYSGRSDIVGQTVQLDGFPCPVVGVMPKDAQWPADTEILQPMMQRSADVNVPIPAEMRESASLILAAIGRLKVGRSLQQTNAMLDAIAKRTEQTYPKERKGWRNYVVPLHETLVGKSVRTSLLVSMAAVCCLLAIAVINVAGLLLARAITRRQEMQIRAALGASRWQLTRHLLAESAVLAAPAGVLGLLFSIGVLKLLSTLSLPGVPPLPLAQIDSGMFAVALGVSMLTALVCGLAPLVHTLRQELNPTVTHGSTRGLRMLNGLIVVEITLSVLLLVGAGLLVRSFMAIQRIDPGFQNERLLTFNVAIPSAMRADAAGDERQKILAIFRDLIGQLENSPGVATAALSSALPLGGGGEYFSTFFDVEGRSQTTDDGNRPAMMAGTITSDSDWYKASSNPAHHPAMMSVVGAGYFNTMGVRTLSGRDFDSRDTPDSPPVVIINEALAQRIFPNENPLGKRIRSSLGWDGYREIVGVTGNVRFMGRDDELRSLAYVPHAQWAWSAMTLNVRTVGDSSVALQRIRSYIKRTNPKLVVTEAKTMNEVLNRSMAPRRSGMTLIVFLSGTATLLAAIGLYGALSYAVAQRVREIGIRMALGARPINLLGAVVGQSLRLTLLGVALGLSAAALLTRWMAHLLYEVSAIDPTTFIAIALLLTGVALMACYLPARRAVRVDPISALRAE